MKVMLINALPQADNDLTRALAAPGNMECIPVEYHPDNLRLIVKQQPDLLVFIVLKPGSDLLEMIHLLNQETPKPIILFAAQCEERTVNTFVDAGVASLIVGEIPYPRLSSILEVAQARFRQAQQQQQQLENYKQQLEDRKVIDKAKGILMTQKQLSEDAAYQLLRKMAMDRNMRLGEAAQNFIIAANLLK